MSASLSVSVVTYDPDLLVLAETLGSLAASLGHARQASSLDEVNVAVVDNGPGNRMAPALGKMLQHDFEPPIRARLLTGHGNVGYGRGNNLVLLDSVSDFHLVLNPDVSLAQDAIYEALQYMGANPGTVILAPDARDSANQPLFLCKRYPSVLDLLLRGFAPAAVRRGFRARLEQYEMRDLPRSAASTGIPLLSGSFMFCRRAPIAAIGGFSDAFFLYFEDFDLSLRAAGRGALAFVPSVRIVHRGGNTARKGPRHVFLFVRSAITFFNRHGWRWL